MTTNKRIESVEADVGPNLVADGGISYTHGGAVYCH